MYFFFSFDKLEYQHRMRTSIANIMRLPGLYPTLKDNNSVSKYPKILGVSTNFHFIDHRVHEANVSFFSFQNIFDNCNLYI